jgi:hypothetical protein
MAWAETQIHPEAEAMFFTVLPKYADTVMRAPSEH